MTITIKGGAEHIQTKPSRHTVKYKKMIDYSVKLEKLNHFLALGINIEPGKDR